MLNFPKFRSDVSLFRTGYGRRTEEPWNLVAYSPFYLWSLLVAKRSVSEVSNGPLFLVVSRRTGRVERRAKYGRPYGYQIDPCGHDARGLDAGFVQKHMSNFWYPDPDRVVIIHGDGTDLDSHGLCVRIATRAIRTRIWRFWTFVR